MTTKPPAPKLFGRRMKPSSMFGSEWHTVHLARTLLVEVRATSVRFSAALFYGGKGTDFAERRLLRLRDALCKPTGTVAVDAQTANDAAELKELRRVDEAFDDYVAAVKSGRRLKKAGKCG